MNEPYWLDSRMERDIDGYTAAQGGWRLHYEQLSEGTFEGRLQSARLPGITLLREDINVATRQRGRLALGTYGFATPLQPTTGLYFNGHAVGSHGIMCGKGDEVDLRTPPSFTLLALMVERELLAPLWERMYHKPLVAWLEHKLVLDAEPHKAAALRELHLAALQQVSALSASGTPATALLSLRDDLLIEWMEALPSVVDLTELPSIERRKRLVDRACEMMLESPDEPLSMLALCQRLGVSRRKLNYCFQDVLGTSPLKYLRTLRLNGVHRALRHAPPQASVQDIAAHWGFWHGSQFAVDYRKQFGEKPSDTLRRGLGNRNTHQIDAC